MKVIKPKKLGVVTRCFERHRRFYMSIGVLTLHRFGGGMASEMDMWPFLAGELGPDGVADAGMPKSRGEFLVSGSAFSADESLRQSSTIQVRVGALEKALWVYGDRFWTEDEEGRVVVTDPRPFAEMQLTWDRAFGGPGFDRNPLGRGVAPVDGDGGPVHPLPNVELPGQSIRSMADRPEPAGLGPLDITWPQRSSKAGTYDAEWAERLSPGFAGDIDWSIFNVAPEDQQQDAPFHGDESFVVHGMHPSRPRQEGRLPGLAARCFVNVRTPGGDAFREVAMRLTTVWLFPHAEKYLLVQHGFQEIAEEDGADVLQAVFAAERLKEPRPVGHYQDVLARRLDPEKGALYALRDGDLLPVLSPEEDEPDQRTAEFQSLMEREGLREKYQRRRHEREVQEARAFVAARGLDPDVHGPPPLPPERPAPTLEELPEVMEQLESEAERLKKAAEEQRERRKEQLRAQLAAEGQDVEAILAQAEQPPGGPPRFRATAEIAMLRARFAHRRRMGLPLDPVDRMAEDPEHHRRLVESGKRMREAYRQMAHEQGAPPRLAGEEAARVRAATLARLQERGDLVRHDLTGFDLSGLDLRGVDLTGTWMENANLAGADLDGANLTEAVLARADLTGTNLARANLGKANLGLARLVRTRLDEADLTEAILTKARFEDASLRQATLESADLREAEFQGADLSGVILREALLLNHDLRRVHLVGADLGKTTLVEVDVRGVDFTGATLEEATFLGARGEGAVFCDARMTNSRFVHGCAFPGADFRDAVLVRANLRGTTLTGSDLSGADLGGADLSECELTGARLAGAKLRDALLTKATLTGAHLPSANLMGALLQRADLSGADLQGANLFQADLARVRTDEATNMEGTNLQKARLHPREESG